jgi:hypothetical protein
VTAINWIKTTDLLPPIDSAVELLGYGDDVSGHTTGMYAIMRYDGTWWNEDGTELSSAPEYWAKLTVPPCRR